LLVEQFPQKSLAAQVRLARTAPVDDAAQSWKHATCLSLVVSTIVEHLVVNSREPDFQHMAEVMPLSIQRNTPGADTACPF
jgi:hypothetical protein